VTQRRRKENQKKRRGKNLTKWGVCFKKNNNKEIKKESKNKTLFGGLFKERK
jgi:hypothetical protein